MLKGNWHYIALSAVFSLLALQTNQIIIFTILLFAWLIYLYVYKRITLIIVSLALISYISFYLYFPSYERDASFELSSSSADSTVSGTILSPVDQTEQLLSFTFREAKTNDRILVTHFYHQSEEEKTNSPFPFTYRANCKITGKIDLPEEATNPFQFNYRKHLFEQGIRTQLIVSSLDHIQCEQKSSLLTHIYSLRDRLINKASNELDPDIAAWQQALIFGNSDDLDEDIELLFQRWGLSHLLAISGLHVGIIIAIVYMLLLGVFNVTKEKASLFVLLFLPIYALIAGGQPSVWRASLMTVVLLLLSSRQIKMGRLDILSIVFLFLIMMNKFIIYHIGFQFSFAVTLGLILSARWFSYARSPLETILQISFIAQMMIVPIQMYYFHHFQPLSILLNLIIVPYFSFFVIPTMFFSMLLYVFPKNLSNILEHIFLKIHKVVLNFIQMIDQYINIPFISGEITLTIAFVYYSLLFLMMIKLEENHKRSAFYYGFGICLLLTFVIAQPYMSKTGTVTMLDIGQGDAFVIELPKRQGVFLIDAGASFDFETMEPRDTMYKRVIRPYLMGRGIQKIDAIFVSHFHLDHHGSVRFIMEDFDVGEILVDEYADQVDVELQKWLEHKNVKIRPFKAGTEVVINNHSFYALSPLADRKDKNDNSLVLYSKFGKDYWLFTGDISRSIEQSIIDKFRQLHVDVLKVAHHGSNTSSDEPFLQQLQPKVALIPVGRRNRYGHPAKEVIESLNKSGASIYRTDKDGAVQYKYKQGKTKIITYND